MNRSELPTPALLLDLDRFERNIHKMAAHVKAAGKNLPPHAKPHKCPEIAPRQVAAGAPAVLSVTAEDTDAARLADQINRTMDWAIKTAKTHTKVESRTGGYQTYPVYDKDRIQRWRATQELLLEGADFAQLGELIGKLQERLQVTAITFSVSPERRATVEDELIARALEAFKQRADLVRKQLAAKGYRIVDVSINQGGFAPVPRPMMRAAASMPEASVAPPAVQAGTSTLSVNVSGVIELQ